MPAWTDDYVPLIETTEGDDFIAELSKAEVVRDKEFRDSPMSAAWAAGRKKSKDASRKVFDMMRIRGAVASIAKIHGAPPETRIELATLGQAASGCAGWGDLKNWSRPHILLDSGIYEWCDGPEMLDAYCGVGVHEAEHLISTRRMLLRMEKKELTGNRMTWEQLLEDERIENLARERSPGYAPYLHAAKRVIFDRMKIKETVKNWDKLPDLDKLTILIFVAIRCPYLLLPEMKEWRTIRGRCAFEELRGVVPMTPKTELNVESFGKRLMDFYDSMKKDYDTLAAKDDEDFLRDLLSDEELKDLKDAAKKRATDCTKGEKDDSDGTKADAGSDEEISGTDCSGEPRDGDGSDDGGSESPDDEHDASTESGSSDGESLDGAGDSKDDGTTAEGRRSDDDGDGGERSEGADAGGGDSRSGDGEPGSSGRVDAGDSSDVSDAADPDGEGSRKGSFDGETEEDSLEADDGEAESSAEEATSEKESTGSSERGRGDDLRLDDVLAACDDEAKAEKLRDWKERRERHREAAKLDAEVEKLSKALEDAIKRAAESIKDMKSLEKVTEAMKDGSTAGAERSDKELEGLKDSRERLEESRKGERFVFIDLKAVMDKFYTVGDEMSWDETAELAKAEDERLEFTEPESCPCDRHTRRRTVIVHPKADDRAKQMYQKVSAKVQPWVGRIRNVLSFRAGKKTFINQELVEGRLDRRMIGRARSTDRIFRDTTERTAKGLAICLLLDESGSMGTCYHPKRPDFNSRAGIALQIAVMFAKALQNVPGIELEIYSYASCNGHDDNLIKYLYGKRQPRIESICGYGSGAQNYDHMAIREAGKLFEENTQNENRLMLILSDGAPCGNGYGGRPAIKATHDEVKKLEKRMHVVQIAITAFASEQMFTNFIRFLDMRTLLNDMRKLLQRVIRRVS